MSGSFRLFGQVVSLVASKPRLFGGLLLTYAVLSILLVRGLGGGVDLPGLKTAVNGVFTGQLDQLGTAIALLGYLGSNAATPTSDSAAITQNILLLIVSLALIWLLRQVVANKLATVRLAFYNGMYPLITFVLVLLVIGLQLLPAILGNAIFGLVVAGGLAVTVLEKWLWALFFGLLVLLSFYLISSSVFALYIVTLPNMTPLKALRSARELVLHRRLEVMRRLIGLPVILLAISLVVMLPLIIYIPAVAEWSLFCLNLVFLIVGQTYVYILYRELLQKS